MKAVSARITKGLKVGSFIKCADNSGANVLQIISIKGFKGVKRRQPDCGVGSWIMCTIKEGDPKMRHQIVFAVIIRQKQEYRRKSGIRINFEDNAAVLINEKGEPRGTKIKGPVAREVVERFSTIGKIATVVI